MKICWDNLEMMRLTRNGDFRKGSTVYVEKEKCMVCGDSYLTVKSKPKNVCSNSCSKIGMKRGDKHHFYGKHLSEEHRQKLRGPKTEAHKKKISKANSGENHPLYGKHHTLESRKKMSKGASRRRGTLSSNWKGGVKKTGLTIYDTCKNTLGLYETIRKQADTELLEVKCTYCGKWYPPTYSSVGNRLNVINGRGSGENRLYCSENCKESCPTYKQVKYPKGFRKGTSREVSTYLRQMVFERDNWECQMCGKTIEEVQLHCHHIKGYAQNKILANDVDNCITFCKECHKEAHKLPGCRYIDLRCKKEE